MKHRLLVASAMLALTTPSSAAAESGDLSRGERMYRACAACHSLEPNRNMTGPSLAEVWNRKAGSLLSFPRYSPALTSVGIVWTDDTLDQWIKDPLQGQDCSSSKMANTMAGGASSSTTFLKRIGAVSKNEVSTGRQVKRMAQPLSR